MNGINVSGISQEQLINGLQNALATLTPEARKLATYVLENPQNVALSTVREISQEAKVTPNTVVRMARQLGFEGYEDFRHPFKEALRDGPNAFPDRARWLQSLNTQGQLGTLYADMVSASLRNIEETFSGIDASELQAAAEDIWAADRVFTLGVGVNAANAQNFTYLASTGMVRFEAIPKQGSNAIDDLAWVGSEDLLIAMTCKPYRREVVEAVELACDQGVKVVAISDSPAAPIFARADHSFVLCVDTPQFFPSSVATIALLETLLSFVVASGSPKIVSRVDEFHKRRHALGLYEDD